MAADVTPGQVVVLNGAPRSGKSSVAKAVQDVCDGVWMNLGVDGFMSMTPERYLPGIGLRPGGERPDLEPIIARQYFALYDSVAAHSRLGLNVVVDVGHHDMYSKPLGILPQCARRLDGLPALFVGVRCPVTVAMERRRQTGWEADDAPDSPIFRRAVAWEREVHLPGVYDLEVDTSRMSPEECAIAIGQRLDEGPEPCAFRRIAEMGEWPAASTRLADAIT